MRLDTHIHVYNEGALAKIKGIVGPLHTTHYVAIMEDNALHLTSHLDEAGAKGTNYETRDNEARVYQNNGRNGSCCIIRDCASACRIGQF